MKPARRLRFIKKSIRRKFKPYPALDDLEFLVVSPGGVGTTFLMKYLAGMLDINDPEDADHLKHWHKPPSGQALADAPRMLFVTGDPDVIVASIARRGWLRHQSAKLGSFTGTVFSGHLQRKVFRKAVEAQIAAWTACTSDKLLIVAYDELWDRAGDIARHAGLDPETFVASFPPRKERKSVPA